MTIIHTLGGMGDLLLTMSSFADLQDQTGEHVIMLFDATRNNAHKFNYYFDTTNFKYDIRDVDMKNKESTPIHWFDGLHIDKQIQPSWLRGVEKQNTMRYGYDVEYAKKHNVFIRESVKYPSFGDLNIKKSHSLFKKIKPSSNILKRVQEYMQENNWSEDNKPIGIHIRRTDHKRLIEESPTYLFIDKIEELISKNPNVRIFLCTDDDCLRAEIRHKYGKNILTRDILKRFATGSYEDVVIDMFLLSNCCELYGCYSGFVICASLFGDDIPLTILRQNGVTLWEKPE